uniref:AcidPPc domain-containing protein n=1 Tax=Parastrongyloides trichosuri TaxID=131310 RepID=A0A0N4Z8U8_PARTI
MKQFSITKILIDISIFAVLFYIYYLLHRKGIPKESGFFCDDYSIRKPFKEETFPIKFIYIFGLISTITIIAVVEIVKSIVNKSKYQNYSRLFHTITISYTPNCFMNFYHYFTSFLLGLTAKNVVTKIVKLVIGRKRPFFIEVCKPNIDCNKFNPLYVSSYECLGANKKLIRAAHMSFYSGHSAFSFFVAVYMMIYLHYRVNLKGVLKYLVHLVQFLYIVLASTIAISRITDNWHHPSDVVIGSLVGIIFAFMTTFKLAKISEVDIYENNMKVLSRLPFYNVKTY